MVNKVFLERMLSLEGSCGQTQSNRCQQVLPTSKTSNLQAIQRAVCIVNMHLYGWKLR